MFRIQTTTEILYEPERLLMYLYDCLRSDSPAEIDCCPEGPCLESAGVYALLDRFCEHTGYDARAITINTANMIESHDRYRIRRRATYWYEIDMMQKWAATRSLHVDNQIEKHFGNFVGRATWARSWLAAWLNQQHATKSLQTFHTGFSSHYRTNHDDGVYDQLGLDLLNHYDCDMIPEVAKFLDNCPMVIPEDLAEVQRTKIAFDQPSYYPLQHPANLNVIDWYRYFFVDIIVEANVSGQCFLVTEKTWRCMLAKRPFMVLSNTDFLYNLQKLGFKTFHDFWNESYDGQSNQIRIKMLQQEINRVATWSVQELHEKIDAMQFILEHNKKRFLELTYRDLEQTFNVTG